MYCIPPKVGRYLLFSVITDDGTVQTAVDLGQLFELEIVSQLLEMLRSLGGLPQLRVTLMIIRRSYETNVAVAHPYTCLRLGR